jgi:hypothetical protein
MVPESGLAQQQDNRAGANERDLRQPIGDARRTRRTVAPRGKHRRRNPARRRQRHRNPENHSHLDHGILLCREIMPAVRREWTDSTPNAAFLGAAAKSIDGRPIRNAIGTNAFRGRPVTGILRTEIAFRESHERGDGWRSGVRSRILGRRGDRALRWLHWLRRRKYHHHHQM